MGITKPLESIKALWFRHRGKNGLKNQRKQEIYVIQLIQLLRFVCCLNVYKNNLLEHRLS